MTEEERALAEKAPGKELWWLQLRETPYTIEPVRCTDTGKYDPPGQEIYVFESLDGSRAWALPRKTFNRQWRTYAKEPRRRTAYEWPWEDRQCPKCGKWMLHRISIVSAEAGERCRCCGWKREGNKKEEA